MPSDDFSKEEGFIPSSGRWENKIKLRNDREMLDRTAGPIPTGRKIAPDFSGSSKDYAKQEGFIPSSGSSKLNDLLAEHGKSVAPTIRGGAQNPGTRDGGSTTSAEGVNAGPLANLKARLGASRINYAEVDQRISTGPSAFTISGIKIGEEVFFGSHAGTLYQYDPRKGGNVRPVNSLAQWSDRDRGIVGIDSPVDRLLNIFKEHDYISGKRTAGTLLQQQGADSFNPSNLTQRTQAEKARALAVDMLSDNPNDYPEMLRALNQGRGNNPFVSKSGGSTAYPARERADAVMAMLDEAGDTRLAISGAKQGKNAYNSADEIVSRFGEQPARGFDSFYAANQQRPGGAYNLSYTADVFSELPEGQAETHNLLAYRQATYNGPAPAGSTYENGQVILPNGQALTPNTYFGNSMGDYTKDMGRLGSTSAFARMFGKTLGNVATGFVNEVNPQLDEMGNWTGNISMGVGRATSVSSLKSQGVKYLVTQTNRMLDTDVNMRFPDEKRLPAFAIQTLKGEMNQESFRSWFQETGLAAGKDQSWVDANISASNQVSLEGMGVVGTNAIGRLMDNMTYVTRHNVPLDATQYDAMRDANFIAQMPEKRALRMGGTAIADRPGFYSIPVIGQEGAIQQENGTYVVPNFNTPRSKGRFTGNLQAEFTKDTMRLTPGTLNLMSQYNPEQFDSIMAIGRESQKSNTAYNIVASYRANTNEAQRKVVEQMFGIADVDPEKVAAIQSGIIAKNNNIAGGDLIKATMRGLQDEYGNQSLRVGGTTFPNARAIASGITIQDGQLVPNYLSRVANAIISPNEEAINAAMKGVQGANGEYYGGGEQYTNQSGVLTNATSLQLPQLGGFAIGNAGVGANQMVVDRAHVAKITGITDNDRLNQMAESGGLAAVMMRNPVTDPVRDFVNQRVTFYDQMSKDFRQRNPSPGPNTYISPTAQASVGGDFDADRGVSWLNRKFLEASNTMLGGALKVLPNSEILQRAKENAAGEYHKQLEEFAGRSGFDALSLKEKYSMVARYNEKGEETFSIGMRADRYASSYISAESAKSGVGGIYNALERRYGGAANLTSESMYTGDNSNLMSHQRSAISTLSGYAQQKLLDENNVTDTNLNDLIERANNGFRNVKNGVASYSVLDKAKGEFNNVATSDSAFYEQNFNKWLDIGSNLSNEEYDRLGLGRSIATQIMSRKQMIASENDRDNIFIDVDENISAIERKLMDRRQFGASAENTQNILTLTGATSMEQWGAGDENGGLETLSPAAQMTLGPISARAQRTNAKKGNPAFPVGRQLAAAGKVAQAVAANLMNIDKMGNGREGAANTEGLTSRMRNWLGGMLPAASEAENLASEVATNAVQSAAMTDVDFSNAVNQDAGFIPAGGNSGNSSGEGIPFSGGGNRGGGNNNRTFTAPLSGGGGGGRGSGVVINFNRQPPSPGRLEAARRLIANSPAWLADVGALNNPDNDADVRGTSRFRLEKLQRAANMLGDQSKLDGQDRFIIDSALARADDEGVSKVNPLTAAARAAKSVKAATVKPVDELKMANANAAQGYIGKLEDVPDILMKLADSIAGVGKVSEETVEKAQKYVKAFKDSGDQLEQAIKTHEGGGSLTPSQKKLIGLDANGELDLSGAGSRLDEQRRTASFLSGSLYKLGMGEGEIEETPPTKGNALTSAYNRIIKGTGLFHAKLALGVFVNPAIREAQQYQEYQAGIGQSLFESGQVNYSQLLQGTFGTIARREATTEQARLSYGQQVLSAYSPFVNAALSPQVASGPLGAAASILGPAAGAGIAAASLFNPVIGGLVAGGTALVGTAGYINSSMNPTDIRAKMELGRVAMTGQGNFQGNVGAGGNIASSYLQASMSSIGDTLAGRLSVSDMLQGKTSTGTMIGDTYNNNLATPSGTNINLVKAVNLYKSGTSIQQIQKQFPNINIADVMQGTMDETIQELGGGFNGSQGYGLLEDEAQASLQPFMYYNKGGTQPTSSQLRNIASNYQAGNNAGRATGGILANLGLSPRSNRAAGIENNTSAWLAGQDNQTKATDSLDQAMQMTTQANLMAQQSGRMQINPQYAEAMYTAYGAARPIAIAQESMNASDIKLTNPEYYKSGAFQSTFKKIDSLNSSGQYGLATQAETQRTIGSDLYNRLINIGGSAGQANGIVDQFNQSGYGTAAQAQFSQQLINGDRTSLSILGQRTGNQSFITMNTQTGMDVTYQNIPKAWQQFARANDPYNQLSGITDAELASGNRGMSAEIFNLNRGQQLLEYGVRTQGRDVGYNLQTGNLSAVASLYGQAGMGFNPGNGMGYNQLQDAGIQLNRAQQRFGYQQDTTQLGIQEAQYNLQGRQFYQGFDLQQRKFDYNTNFQRTQMQIDQSHTVEQQGWQTEDLAYGRAQLDIHFGWQQQDFTRNIRYARGREKRDLMREQQRSVVEYAMQAGHQDVESGRNQTQIQWEQQDFDRRKQYFEQETRFQRESMDQQKQFFEQGRELDRQRLDLQQAAHQKQLLWMTESFKLEDQRISLERQNYQYQYNQQVLIDTTSQQTTIHVQNLSNAMNGLGSFLDTLIAKGNTLGGIASAVAANQGNVSINSTANSIGQSLGSVVGTIGKIFSGVISSSGSYTPLPAVSGTNANGTSVSSAGHGFAGGGYTGHGMRNDPKGIVHAGEYVVPQEGSMVIRGQDEHTSKKQDDMIRLLEASVKVQQKILEKDASFTAIINGKSTSGIPTNLSNQSRAKF